MTARLLRSAAALILAAAIVVGPISPVYGQEQSAGEKKTAPLPEQTQAAPNFTLKMSAPDYSIGRRQFPNLIAPYSPIKVNPPELTDSPRLEQLIHDGKLQLSLQDAIALALENNLDIAVQRYNPWISETDILRTMGGGAARGLSGTGTASVEGAIPQSTFDPAVTSTLSWDRRSTPVNNPFTSGTGTSALSAITNNTAQANFAYSQGLHTGTAYAITFNNTRASTTNPATIFNPSVNSSLFFSFTQQLLNGFGLLPNTRFIRIAKNSKKVADLAFEQQVMTSVTQVANLYWELAFAREDVKVKQRAVGVAEKLYSDNKRQVEIGTLAPIEVVRAEAEVARNRQDLIVAQTVQLQQQTLLTNAISKNLVDVKLIGIEIIPTDPVTQSIRTDIKPLQEAVSEALTKRPDVLQQKIDLLNRDINVRATRNALLPTATLFGQYGATGLGGNQKQFTSATVKGAAVLDANGNPRTDAFLPATVLTQSGLSRGGLYDALFNVYQNNFPEYTVQLTLNIPIRNRPGQADSARAQLEQRQAETRLRQLENSVAVDVRNTQIALEQDRARVEAASKARILQEQTLDAEQKKYQLGASTIFFVIQAQRDLANAQDVELRALVDLLKAKIDYERALGRTLEVNHVSIADAKGGQVHRDTLIPGYIRGDVVTDRKAF